MPRRTAKPTPKPLPYHAVFEVVQEFDDGTRRRRHVFTNNGLACSWRVLLKREPGVLAETVRRIPASVVQPVSLN